MMKKTFYGIIILIVIALILGGYFLIKNKQVQVFDKPGMSTPDAVLVKFISGLQNDKPDEVYDSISEYDRQRFSRADYGKWVDLRSKVIKIDKYEYKEIKTEKDVTLGDNKYEICVTYHIKTESSATLIKWPPIMEFDQPVVFENGSYRVYTQQTEIKADIDGFTEVLKKAGK